MKFIKKRKFKNNTVPKPKSRQELRKIQRKSKKQNKNIFFKRKNNSIEDVKLEENKKTDLLKNKKPKKKNKINTQGIVQRKEDEYSNSLNLEQKELKKEMELHRIEQLKMANESEDKLIKKLEKDLHLKKRKSNSVPQSFASDGLDYLLEICDNPESISRYPENFDESGSDLEDDMSRLTNKKRKIDEKKDKKGSKKEEGESELEDEEGESELEDEEGESEFGSEEGESEFGDEEGEFGDEEEEGGFEDEEGGFEDEEEEVGDEAEESEFEEKEDEDEEEESEFGDEEEEVGDEEDLNELIDEEESHELEDKADNKELKLDENEEMKKEENKKDDKLWEDIYGRVRDAKGNVVVSNKYIPPQQRETSNNNQARKIMKRLFNKLSATNIKGFAQEIEKIYQTNSRHYTNETFTNLIFESIVSPTLTPERLITEYAMLVGILHAHVGPEIGAHILQEVIKHFHQRYMKYTDHELKTKELANLILFISYLYCFKIFHSLLIYDILELFANNFQEKDIELILIILKSAGFILRKDDPNALKKLILNLQTKANQKDETGDGTRCQFMLDILLAIKNNNMTKIPNYDPSHLENLKKSLKTILRKGTYISEIKISLDDLLKADERGRWWIVGSAWTGPAVNAETTTTPKIQFNNEHSQKLLEIARKQRMNTDSRRNIFCILMSAEDYNQAYEKLIQLGLKNQQERDIIYVLVHCCLQEKKFNPYYAFVAQQLCLYERRFQLTYQYTLWDRLRELQQLTDTKVSNLALLTKHLIIEKVLPLSVIKAVEFVNMEKRLERFLRQLLLGLLLDEDEENCKNIFEKITQKENMKQFRDGLRLFLNHFLLRKSDANNIENKELLKERIHLVDKIISFDQHKVKY